MSTSSTDWAVLSNRLLLLQELMVGLSKLRVEEVLSRAADGVSWVFGAATLHALAPAELSSPPLVPRGRVQLPQFGEVYLAYFAGPPEPRYLLLAGLELIDPQEFRLAALFCEHLVAALEAAGYREELARQARTDWLTGLPNRRSFEQAVQRGAFELGVTVAALGVLEGRPPEGEADSDLLLKRLAQTLQVALPKGAHAFRTGAFRLTVLLPDADTEVLGAALAAAEIHVSAGWALSCELSTEDFAEAGTAVLAAVPAAPEGWPDRKVKEASAKEVGILFEQATARLEAVLGGVWREHAASHHFARSEGSAESYVEVYSGFEQVRLAYRELVASVALTVPVALVLDGPYGYAFELLSARKSDPPTAPASPKPVLVISENPSQAYLHDLISLEPEGLLVGGVDDHTLLTALERAASGERFYQGPAVVEDPLYPREREVWRLVVQGFSNGQIAEALAIREKTVANYVTSLQEKLHLSNRVELVLSYLGKLEAQA